MKILLLFFFAVIQLTSFAQININGKVVDGQTNETLIGVNVKINGTNIGTATNLDGNFNINIKELPIKINVSYIGYKTEEILISSSNPLLIKLYVNSKEIDEVKVIDTRITKKQKEAALTVEALDMIAIKETPSSNFYDGLGALKGVDITAASLGFKVINTRGFNSTSPVRSLQIIDGVDNQSPGLNFPLGNFLGSSELDIMKELELEE